MDAQLSKIASKELAMRFTPCEGKRRAGSALGQAKHYVLLLVAPRAEDLVLNAVQAPFGACTH